MPYHARGMTNARVPRLLAALLLALLATAALRAGPATAEEASGALVIADGKTIVVKEATKPRTVPGHSFGIVAQQADVSVALPYRNTGTQPLEGIRVSSGCSCFGATLSDRMLAPGAQGTLTIRFRSSAMKGTVEKPMRLLYVQGGAKALTTLYIQAKVIAGVLVERAWFGEVRSGSTPSASAPLAWFHGVGTPFEIEKIEVSGPKMSTRVEPYQVGDGSTYRGFTIHFTFEEPPPKGIYSRKAVVHTTHPDHPTVLVPLNANVVGALWVQTSRIYLGLVPEGTARSASVKIKLSGKEPPPLGAVEVKARGGLLKIAVKDGFDPFVGPHKVVTVTVPADTKAGKVDDVLEVRATQAGDDVTEIQVLGRVYTPQGR